MSDVEFKDSGWRAMKYYREPTVPKIIQWTMKYSGGMIKNEKQAGYVVFGFVAIAITISLFLFFNGLSLNKEKIISPLPAAGPGDPNFHQQ